MRGSSACSAALALTGTASAGTACSRLAALKRGAYASARAARTMVLRSTHDHCTAAS